MFRKNRPVLLNEKFIEWTMEKSQAHVIVGKIRQNRNTNIRTKWKKKELTDYFKRNLSPNLLVFKRSVKKANFQKTRFVILQPNIKNDTLIKTLKLYTTHRVAS